MKQPKLIIKRVEYLNLKIYFISTIIYKILYLNKIYYTAYLSKKYLIKIF